MPQPRRPLTTLEVSILRYMRAKPYGQTATAIWRDGMFEGEQLTIRAALGGLARRRLVASHGCSRTTLWELTDKGTSIDLPEAAQ